jgi:hypothetical protein
MDQEKAAAVEMGGGGAIFYKGKNFKATEGGVARIATRCRSVG